MKFTLGALALTLIVGVVSAGLVQGGWSAPAYRRVAYASPYSYGKGWSGYRSGWPGYGSGWAGYGNGWAGYGSGWRGYSGYGGQGGYGVYGGDWGNDWW